jgi:putative flippase GtrA
MALAEHESFTETRRQLLRYALIGAVSNAGVYAGYLLLTALGAGPKTAMTIVYCGGTLATFMFNRRWTFDHEGTVSGALGRYVMTYAGVYVFNAVSLVMLVDIAGLPHRLVMLAMIFVSAGLIFVLQKFWVFARSLEPGNDRAQS